MQEILTRIAEEDDYLPTYRLSLFGLMAELAALFLNEGVEKEQNATNPESAKYYAIIEPAIRMIRDNYSQPKLSVDALAAACNVSKYHFCHVFKSVTGFGAISYLNAYRLKIANNLLKTSDKSVSEIAFSCGFEDASYFSKLYKQKFNKTPKSDKSFATG
jgi:transcriptional regulator GlxA family with amidase domain